MIEQLGRGASGLVYLAEDLVLGRPVVLKRLPPGSGDDARERALVEARTIAALNHPNICTLYQYEEAEGEQFLVLEVLEGRTLEALLAAGPLPLAQLLDLGVQIADALDAAHTHGIIHRDIKPPNVFVTFKGQAKILDFGIAVLSSPGGASRYTAGATTPTGGWGGTLHYMAPEQLRGEVVDARADLFSLGALLYEMATGHRAFAGQDPTEVAAAILGGAVRPVRSLRPDVPAELERIIGRALEKHPDLRCQSAADLRADLQRLKRQIDAAVVSPSSRPVAVAAPLPAPAPAPAALAPGAARAPGAAKASRRRVTRMRPAWAIGAVAAIAAAIGLPVFLLRGSSEPRAAAIEPVPQPPSVDAVLGPAGNAPVATPGHAVVWTDPPSDQLPDPVAAARPRRAQPSSEPADTPAVAAIPEPTFEAELTAARAAVASKRFDEATAVLRDVAAKAADTAAGIEAQILLAQVQERQLQLDDAIAAYAAIVARHPNHPKAAEALYYQAKAILASRRGDRDLEARKLFDEIASRFRGHAFVGRALLARGEIEARRQTYQYDRVLGKAVPASLVTYRTLVHLGSAGREREHAMWRLAQTYERIERFDLAAQTYRDLGERYSETHYDAWAAAGRLYDERLNDPALARAAYRRVPASSPAFRDAQRYVNRSPS